MELNKLKNKLTKNLPTERLEPSYGRAPFQDEGNNNIPSPTPIQQNNQPEKMKQSTHSRQPSCISENLKTQTASDHLILAFGKKLEIKKRIEELKSKPIFYFEENTKSIIAQKNPGLATLAYELKIDTSVNNGVAIKSIAVKNTQGTYIDLTKNSECYNAKTKLLESYLENKLKAQEILDKINAKKSSANNSSASEDEKIKKILSDMQNYIDQAFEKNEIRTQADLLYYSTLISETKTLLKSTVTTNSQTSPKGKKTLTKSASKVSVKNDNTINLFTENNNKFCQFLDTNNIILSNSNVEALKPCNISNKPFTLKGKTFFLSKQQIKYLTDIKSLLLTENQSESTKEPVIINGVPGSGKSYLIKLITEEKENLKSLLEQIDARSIDQLKYEAKELNYCVFYNYPAGKVSVKTNVEIKEIIDTKISDENSKLFLMVDEWGVMYPPYATEYLKTIQQTKKNIAIIGISANPEPIKALLDSAHNTLSNRADYKNHNIINGEIFNNNHQPAGPITGTKNSSINYNHIVDFTAEINSSDKLEAYIEKNASIIPDNSYVICNYKRPTDQKNYFFICQKNNNTITKISKEIKIGETLQNVSAFNQEELLSLIKNNFNQNNFNLSNFNLIASHSTARGADFNAIINNINSKINLPNTQHNYKIIDNEISGASSSVNAMANIAQGLQRARLLTTKNLQLGGKLPNNHHIEIYKREKEGVVKYENKKLAVITNENNNFFKLAELNNTDEYKNLSQIFSSGDLAILKSEIQKCENIEKYQNIKNTIDFIKFLKTKLPLNFDYSQSLNELINSNKEEKEFNKYHCLARASLFLEPISSQYKTPSLEIKNNEDKAIKIKNFFITDFKDKDNYEIQAKNIEADNAKAIQPIKSTNFVTFSVKNGKIDGYNNQQKQQNNWSCCEITGAATGVIAGALGLLGYFTSAGNSTGSVSVAPASPVTPNYPVTSNGTAKLHWHISNANHDLNSPSQPTNTNQLTSISKNSHLNHLTHAHHLGISKISAISTSCSSLTKAGTIAKAGLLACTLTPFLAVAGIGAVGYLGYKAFEYFYKNENKENFVQNNKKELDKLNLYQKNNQGIELKNENKENFVQNNKKELDKLNLYQKNNQGIELKNEYRKIIEENKEKPSILINPNNIKKFLCTNLSI